MDGYIGEIKMFSGDFVPKGWMLCNGEELAITKYVPLYSIIGNVYGGNGSTVFNLPDFCGRVAVGLGIISVPGDIGKYNLGEKNGNNETRLMPSNIPELRGGFVDGTKFSIPCAADGGAFNPIGKVIGGNGDASIFSGIPTGTLEPFDLNKAISGDHLVVVNNRNGHIEPLSIMQPGLVIFYIICVNGLYPDRGE
ncbi:phage tail protein [Flavobacterium restrictum]|uniref:Phage tail collar domain-containing protein n=1 Tax=Flavobacterium restrictum TaxID=2594428 RepID=A0A553DWP3_9FLAO|nr:tail fiber protein [Flavobacterium restrictum]TRX37100.1 hypothetical protein FNW21_12970 [Flavobacterium restrictum]